MRSARPIPEVGTTRFRPPFSAVSIGSLAAERYGDVRPERLTPMHDWHVEHGATLYAAGLWYRPAIYGQSGETVEQAYVRETKATRETAGIVDVSTLGKIAVQGPDAADFLDRVYTNLFSTLAVGKARYGLMLREDGIAFDDGTTWRLGEDDFLMTTTTANAGKVMQHLEYYLDVVWPDLKVHVTSVTDQWAGAAIGGPKAREILAACVTGTPVDNEALPFMGIVHGEIAGAPVMICRLSFSGEMAFEVYSGAGHGMHVWEALIEAGKPFGLVPYGLEALGTMRIEKGHVTGAEIDGRTTAHDLHLDWMLSKKKPFIGSMMLGPRGPRRAGPGQPRRRRLARQPAAQRRRHIVDELDAGQSARLDRPHHRRLLFARRSAAISGWRWSRAARSATARAPSSPTRCATASARSRSSATTSSTRKGSACMVDQLSPLQPVLRPGSHGNFADGTGVTLSETQPGSIVQVAAWPGQAKALIVGDQDSDRPVACRTAPAAASRRPRQGRLRHRAGKIPGRRPGRRAGGDAVAAPSPARPARSPTSRMAAPRCAIAGTEGRMGAGKVLRHRLLARRLSGRRRAARPTITTSSRRSSGPAPTSSTSTSSAPSPAPSGRRSATPAKRSATR